MSGWNITASSLAVPEIIIGEHIVRTDAQTGALVTVPVSAPVEQAPIPAIDIPALVESVLDSPIEIAGEIITMRSALARLFGQVTDISGTRLPALSAANAVLEATTAAQEARLAAEEAGSQLQALKDAAQDAEQALNALNDSTVAASVSELSGKITDISGAFGARLTSLEAVPAFDDSALRALIADVSGGVAAGASSLAALDSRVAAAEAAVETKAAASALEAYITSNDAAVAAKAAAADLSSLESRVGAVEAAVPSKVAQADYDVHVAHIEGAVSSLDDRVSAAEGAVATKAESADLQALDGRVASAEAAVATKAEATEVIALDGRVTSAEATLATKVSKLTVAPAADYAAAVSLGASGVAEISAGSFALDAGAANDTILFVLAAVDVVFTANGVSVYEMVAGESATLAKAAAGWVGVSGIVPLSAAPAPPAPTYPAAWASLLNGGYYAERRQVTPADVPEGFTAEQLYPEGVLVYVINNVYGTGPLSTQFNYVWFETASGKVSAGSPGVAGTEGRFVSLDATPLSSYSWMLVSAGGTDASDAGVTYRFPIGSG